MAPLVRVVLFAREVGVAQEQARRLEERALARLSADGSLDAWRDAGLGYAGTQGSRLEVRSGAPVLY